MNKEIVGWAPEEENILKNWADQATCFSWIHTRSHEKYYRKYACFMIPVIILSTITGTANFAIDRFQSDTQGYALMVIGAMNLLAALITTITQFLKVSELNESHRVASIAWNKFGRDIRVELAKNPAVRRPSNEMLKYCKDEFDRLIETSPKIDKTVISEFNKVFKSHTTLSKPEITGNINETLVFDRTKPEVSDSIIDSIKLFKQQFTEANGRSPSDAEVMLFITTKPIAHHDNNIDRKISDVRVEITGMP